MAKQVLGSNFTGKKVVSTTGLELGNILDLTYETDGTLVSVLIKPARIDRELDGYLDDHNLINVPFGSVKAVGRYVVVDFPSD